MILRGIDVYSSQDEENDSGKEEISTPKSKNAYPCNGDLLMIKRMLYNQPSP